jgi:membrane-bound serine protease (ClpP class)
VDDLTLGYGLILLGLVLLLAEFLIPSGILFALALTAMLVGLAVLFRSDPSTGIGTLLVMVVAVPLVVRVAFRYWQKSPIGKRFVLQAPPADDTLANMPGNLELEQLRGRYGRTVSALRPAGITDFDGRRVDTLSEGGLIEPGRWVRCIDVKAGQVLVRPVESPPDLGDLNTALFS